MQLISCFTRSHFHLKEYFVESIKDDFDVNISFIPIDGNGKGEYNTEEWFKGIDRKCLKIIDAIESNLVAATPFVWSDVDAQFFHPVKEFMTNALRGNDIVLERGEWGGRVCTGIFICASNKKTLRLWQAIRKYAATHKWLNDQDGADFYLRQHNESGVRWNYLPDTFFNVGLVEGFQSKLFNIKHFVLPAQPIWWHHANWVIGVEQKLAALKHVKHLVKGNGNDV